MGQILVTSRITLICNQNGSMICLDYTQIIVNLPYKPVILHLLFQNLLLNWNFLTFYMQKKRYNHSVCVSLPLPSQHVQSFVFLNYCI